MTAYFGQAMVLAGLACATAGAVAGFGAGALQSAAGWAWARRLAYAFGACMILANGTMEYALLTHDFSVRYVASVGSLSTPAYITIVSLWSSLEGSILFWGLILGVYVLVATALNGTRNPSTMPWATGTWLAVGAFFCFLLAGPANPFLPIPSPIPTDGPGPNPLLQNHALMIVHPPMLYLGYVGMAIPFGLAVGALFAGRLEAAQLAPLRRWLMVPWGFLTIGITLGGWWAYEVLGWGGYWAWDPVENASLLPWLTATAALHAAMLPHRRGALKGWTVTLVIASFMLTLLGTFMTRSGVFNSVHSFSQSDIGPTILAFIAIALVFSVILLAVRVDRLEGEGPVTAVVSRETAFLVNNLLFVALTFTVLTGTTFPLLAEAIKGVKLSVGEPYFNRMAVPIGVAILFLMGVGPALPWGQPSAERVRAQLFPPLLAAVAALAAGLGFGLRQPWPLVTLACGGFAMAVTVRELIGPIRTLNRRRIGGYVVHGGIIVMIVAIAMSSAYRTDAEERLAKGECATFEGYEICFTGARSVKESNRTLQIADVTATRDGHTTTLAPALTSYPGMMTPIGSPDVHSTLTHDLYLSLMSVDVGGGRIGLHVFHTPLVVWIWLGAGICALGTITALSPARKAQSVVVAPAGAEVAGK
jgi:cytochrome c-type biogenesis protein CcmF